jgi:hypothetical protein
MPKKIKISKKVLKKAGMIVLALVVVFLVVWFWPASHPSEKIEYGYTFSAKYVRELGLDPKDVYEATLSELNFKKVRLVAYWDEIQAENSAEMDFSDLDWQIEMSKQYGVEELVVALGQRVPRWPECHVPDWAAGLSKRDRQQSLKEYMTEIVNRYKDEKIITHWQVENEAFFTVYATHICGLEVDEDFIDEEIALVEDLDPTRPIIMTDSGNVGLWGRAYKRGDIFGSTFYVYLLNDGKTRTPLTHNFYKIKDLFWSLVFGEKPVWLIEISVEPWLTTSAVEVPISELRQRLPLDRVKHILEFAEDTGFADQYLWGIEWHYYMKQYGHDEYWNFMKEVMNPNVSSENDLTEGR